MVPIFTAFDHHTYQKVISNHLADVQRMPKSILAMFQQGAFVVSLSGRPWHSTGIDEAHEMKINKDCKTSICMPNPDKMDRLAKYLTYRSTMLHNVREQLFPKKMEQTDSLPTRAAKPQYKMEQNIRVLMSTVQSSSLLKLTDLNRGLLNVFTQQTANEEQHHDLLQFRKSRVLCFTLRQPSV